MDVKNVKATTTELEKPVPSPHQNGSKLHGNRKKGGAKKLLAANTKIKSIRGKVSKTWCVQQHIGSGGFGDVYRVTKDGKGGGEFAMKTEVHGAQQRRLAIEKSILKEIDEFTVEHNKMRHFCELVDSGQTEEYSWLVMTLIGPSLDNIRRMLNKQFSRQCVINMALQILDAIEIMHEVGFIHRDLKPGNICTGMPPHDENTLYILDFGISRRIFKKKGNRNIRNKRGRVPFYGTRKFCNRACHLEQDQGRKDDMETYVYTVLDLFHNEKGLPWARNLKEPKRIVEKKIALFANPGKELDPMIPRSFIKIMAYLDTLKFEDEVDYRFIGSEIKSSRSDKTSESSDELMDWTNKLELLMKQKEEKKKNGGKSDETLIFERLQKARKRDKTDDSLIRGTTGDGSEGPPGTFNERALTTQMTARATTSPNPPPPMIKTRRGKI